MQNWSPSPASQAREIQLKGSIELLWNHVDMHPVEGSGESRASSDIQTFRIIRGPIHFTVWISSRPFVLWSVAVSCWWLALCTRVPWWLFPMYPRVFRLKSVIQLCAEFIVGDAIDIRFALVDFLPQAETKAIPWSMALLRHTTPAKQDYATCATHAWDFGFSNPISVRHRRMHQCDIATLFMFHFPSNRTSFHKWLIFINCNIYWFVNTKFPYMGFPSIKMCMKSL